MEILHIEFAILYLKVQFKAIVSTVIYTSQVGISVLFV